MCTVYHIRSRNIAQYTLYKMSTLSYFYSAPLLTCYLPYSSVVQSLIRFLFYPPIYPHFVFYPPNHLKIISGPLHSYLELGFTP